MNNQMLIFVCMVALAVFLLAIGLSMPVFGENRGVVKRMRRRLAEISVDAQIPEALLLLRKQRLRELSGIEATVENLPLCAGLKILIEQSGREVSVLQVLLLSAVFGGVAAGVAWMLVPLGLLAVVAFVLAAAVPVLRIRQERQNKLDRFEEQLPEAIDMMRRALQAGYPLSEALKLAGEELENPLKKEFALTFSDLNYGSDLKWALMGLLERVPSVNVMALVASILIQRETGGNLAEIMGKLSSVIRGRFRFHRKVRTLSAEGRLSVWILTLVPFVLFAVIYFTTPNYMKMLLERDTGLNLIAVCSVGMVIGIFWMRKIIRIEV